MDFIRQYRPMTNVVGRPTAKGGKGINLTGHHEIMLPLIAAGVIERVNGEKKGAKAQRHKGTKRTAKSRKLK